MNEPSQESTSWITTDSKTFTHARQDYLDGLKNVAGDPLYVHELSGKITQCNESFCRLVGHSRQEVIGMHVSRVMDNFVTQYYHDIINQVLLQGVLNCTGKIVCKNGTITAVDLIISTIEVSGTHYIINHIWNQPLDLTARDIIRQHANDTLLELSRGIAHDFNNILAVIQANAMFIKEEKDVTEKITNLSNDIEMGCRKAVSLNRQLITYSRGGVPSLAVANIGEIIRETVTFCLRGSGVKVNFYIPDDLWNCKVDSLQISQVVQNLVINAKEAMKDRGAITITCRNLRNHKIETARLPATDYVEIIVQDTGPGIEQAFIDQIFDPYFTTKTRGTGLGLSIVRSIIDRHNGHICCQSEIGKGTSFRIYLGAAIREKKLVSNDDTKKNVPQSLRVLVMDDDEGVRKMFERIGSILGYHVILCVDGHQAIQLYETNLREGHRFDIVVLDLIIPGGLGGLDTAKSLRELDSDARVLACSGYFEESISEQYQQHGFRGILPKPFSLADFQVACAQAIK